MSVIVVRKRSGRGNPGRASPAGTRACLGACLGFLVLTALAGCGSDTPAAPAATPVPPLQQATFRYVREADLNAYLAAIGRTVPDFQLIVAEQTVLFGDWAQKRTNAYWTRVYAANLILRIQAYARQVAAIRPANPELRALHEEFVAGVGILESAISDFRDSLEPFDIDLIDLANGKIDRFNAAMNLYMTRLSALSGQPIQLFPLL